jgi:hypothetical protein
MASLVRPVASGAIGSQGHANQQTIPRPAIVVSNVTAVSRPMAWSCRPSRSTFRVSPAMSAMSVVAMPVTTWS